jgi:hypothetical protein
MQGMRDRGEENKIKDVWTGTFVGGNWGDLVASINAGSGRSKVESGQAEYQKETIEAPPLPPEYPNIDVLKDLPQSAVNQIIAKYNTDIAKYNTDYGTTYRTMNAFDVSAYKANIGKQETVKVEPGTRIIAPPKPQASNPITILPQNEVKLPVNNKANVIDTGAAYTFNTSTPFVTSNSNNLQLVPNKGFTTSNNLTFMSALGSLGDPLSIGGLLTTASPIIATMTEIITAAGVIIVGAKKLMDDGKKVADDAGDIINPNNGNNGGGNNNGGSVEPPNSNPNNNPGSGGGNVVQPEGKSNNMLLIGGGIAALVLVALIASKGNAAPSKSNLNGLNGTKTVGERSRTTKKTVGKPTKIAKTMNYLKF